MRHAQTTRFYWGLTALFGMAALLFALRAPPPAAADEGRALYEARCAGCHGLDAAGRWAAMHPDPDERQAWLDSLLQRHHPPAEDERPLIIDYIEATIEEADAEG